MNQDSFISNFKAVSQEYDWRYVENRLIARFGDHACQAGVILNPVTAVTLSRTGRIFPNTKRGTECAGRLLGITQELAMAIYSQSNRGHSQIIRGKLLKSIGI